jgi:1-aminocyclopropane-1-carboxylate deaminase/D-cysteine desulfhydrase-like pyridoxal-dependent ACC family enzyme
MRRLSWIGGALEISFKRDDLTSFAFGDNKVRGLDVLVADAMAQRPRSS